MKYRLKVNYTKEQINKTKDNEVRVSNELPIATFIQKSQPLTNLKKVPGRDFQFLAIENFFNCSDVQSLVTQTTDKADIKVVVHDLNTGLQPTLGFSIKSMIGKDSTLFNPGDGTNFIFKIITPPNFKLDVEAFNALTLLQSSKKFPKISTRIKKLEAAGCSLQFHSIQSENLKLNLELIDSQLPNILSYILYYKYSNSISKLSDLLVSLNEKNPLNYNLDKGHPFYEVKIKNFLTESALGMTPETTWTGVYDATGGIIIVKELGELVCYHIYNRKEFQDYLLNNTKLEQASTSEDENNPGHAKVVKTKPYKFGWVYEENKEFFIKLNLQVRFI